MKRILFGVACLITLIALFYAEENWRGKHAWDKYKREWEAKGEKFDLVSLASQLVPDDQNFAMTTLWVEEVSGMMGMTNAMRWYGDKVAALGHTNFVRWLQMPVEYWGKGSEHIKLTSERYGNWQKGEKFDLRAWQEYYHRLAAVTNLFPVASRPQSPAEDVLVALSKYDSTIERLRAASKLPYARFPLGYGDENPFGILLPHLASLKGCTLTLRLRAVAELQAGQTEKAFNDIQLMLRLIESIRAEPFLISHLVRIAMLQIALQPIWEGLADHKWTDAQLAALDAEVGKLDFLADYQLSIRGERAGGVGEIDFLRHNRKYIANIGDTGGYSDEDGNAHHADEMNFQKTIFRLAPGGWFEQNKISTCRIQTEYYLPIINLRARAFSFDKEKQADEAIEALVTNRNLNDLFAGLVVPALSKASRKFVQAQSYTDMVRIACALERYRLAHGNVPETLDALAPQFMGKIPHDIIGGQPLKYRRTEDGLFVLYSVGWNETDDGGVVVNQKSRDPRNESSSKVDISQGDWVWRYPAKE
ncbi:MAG: hypothetical protein HY298_12500 [Verrucomicrobia bacterium]|nr:hypothetical protein [Verrucomicrobiota bacterium]